MAPAPKLRVPKGKVIEDPPLLLAKSHEENLIGLSINTPKSPSASSGPRHSSTGISHHPPPPKFLLRHRNGDMDPGAPNEPITKLGADEIREHLKHLGPSNLASRPRQTRYQAVKIKAPGGSPTRSGYAQSDDGRRLSTEQRRTSGSFSYQGVIDTDLRSPAARDVSNGTQPLPKGYGTIFQRTTQPSARGDSSLLQAAKPAQSTLETSMRQVPEAIEEHERDLPHPLLPPPYMTPNRSQPSSIHSHDQRFTRHAGPARSGSITEQIIDVNGVRKVVLQMTSSSSSSEADRPYSSSAHHKNDNHSRGLGNSSHVQRKQGSTGPIENEDGHEADGDGTHGGHPLGSLISRMGGGGKKKRKRRKMNSETTTNQSKETQPLLKLNSE